jgi:hypothetical protein
MSQACQLFPSLEATASQPYKDANLPCLDNAEVLILFVMNTLETFNLGSPRG